MGVDYFVCRGCDEPYPDCSSRCTSCAEDDGGCGAGFCSRDCAELRNWDVAPFPTYAEERAMNQLQREALLCSCVICRKESPEAADLVKFLLKRLGMSEPELRAAYTEEASATTPTTMRFALSQALAKCGCNDLTCPTNRGAGSCPRQTTYTLTPCPTP